MSADLDQDLDQEEESHCCAMGAAGYEGRVKRAMEKTFALAIEEGFLPEPDFFLDGLPILHDNLTKAVDTLRMVTSSNVTCRIVTASSAPAVQGLSGGPFFVEVRLREDSAPTTDPDQLLPAPPPGYLCAAGFYVAAAAAYHTAARPHKPGSDDNPA